MKKMILAVLAAAIVGVPAFGREVSKAEGTSFSLKTMTEFGVDLDDPSKYGLAFSLPELSLTFDLFGYQKLSNRLKTPDPVGFIDLTLGQVQIRFANDSVKDYNNPGQVMKLGFNDSAAGKTGYFGPLYLQNVRSGILWGDWIFQLGAGGTDSFWDPWHRENVGYGQMASSWAYLDTRVQYQRPLIPVLVKKPKEEPLYWSYDTAKDSNESGVDELTTEYPGAMIGAQYVGAEFSTMLKLATNKTYAESGPNGVSSGLDLAYTPAGSLKGFRVLSSLVGAFGQGTDHNDKIVSGGVKVGYDIALPKSSLKITSIEPYVGTDVKHNFGVATSAEASTGLTLHWPGMSGWGDDYLEGANGRTGNVYSGATLAYKTYLSDLAVPDQLKHSIQLTWYNDVDGGLVNNVGSEFVAQWKDFTNSDSVLMVTGYLDYSFNPVFGGSLVPWTKVYYDHLSDGDNVMVYGGLKLKKAIRNTEIGVTYESRNLLGKYGLDNETHGYGAVGLVKTYVLISL